MLIKLSTVLYGKNLIPLQWILFPQSWFVQNMFCTRTESGVARYFEIQTVLKGFRVGKFLQNFVRFERI